MKAIMDDFQNKCRLIAIEQVRKYIPDDYNIQKGSLEIEEYSSSELVVEDVNVERLPTKREHTLTIRWIEVED